MAQHGETRTQHHKARQIRVLAAQAVSDPRPHRWTSGKLLTAVEHEQRGLMVRTVGVHRTYDDGFIHEAAEPRKNLADFRPALPAMMERERRFQQGAGLPLRSQIS